MEENVKISFYANTTMIGAHKALEKEIPRQCLVNCSEMKRTNSDLEMSFEIKSVFTQITSLSLLLSAMCMTKSKV